MNEKLIKLLFFLALLEGGAVMCVELCGAKILSPYFGTSIYVWAAVLGITLTALMSGYYLGGFLSSKNKKITLIFWLLLIAGCLVTLIPVICKIILPFAINLNLLLGSVVSLLSFLFLPLVLFGATSPLIINYLTIHINDSGKSSGTVYAVSTFGGIVTTFFIGFYSLPTFGIEKTLYVYGLLIVISSIVIALITKKKIAAQGRNDGNTKHMFFLLVIALLSYNFTSNSNKEIIYQSDGILGELKVVDRMLFNPKENKNKPYRELMVNNISQTIMDRSNPEISYWDYVDLLTNNIQLYAKGKNTLLLGLGGGTLYKQLIKNKLHVDVVEIDHRIEEVAKKYFFIDDKAHVVVDDARHYLNTTHKKYDVIIYDLYHSETPPVHLMTKEAFSEIKQQLTKNGILIINFYGFISGSKGLAARSILKTLNDDGYKVDLFATDGEEKYRNLLFVCGANELNPIKESVNNKINTSHLNLDNAFVLVDDKPILEHIYLEAALSWRKDYNEINAKYFLNK